MEIKTAEQYVVNRVIDLEEENEALKEEVERLKTRLDIIQAVVELSEVLDGIQGD